MLFDLLYSIFLTYLLWEHCYPTHSPCYFLKLESLDIVFVTNWACFMSLLIISICKYESCPTLHQSIWSSFCKWDSNTFIYPLAKWSMISSSCETIKVPSSSFLASISKFESECLYELYSFSSRIIFYMAWELSPTSKFPTIFSFEISFKVSLLALVESYYPYWCPLLHGLPCSQFWVPGFDPFSQISSIFFVLYFSTLLFLFVISSICVASRGCPKNAIAIRS